MDVIVSVGSAAEVQLVFDVQMGQSLGDHRIVRARARASTKNGRSQAQGLSTAAAEAAQWLGCTQRCLKICTSSSLTSLASHVASFG
jgi:hypothetical protein